MRYGVIMAGGTGSRLWPLSRESMPKQLLPMIDGRSLLQLSYDRLAALLPPERIYVCTAAAHGDRVRRNLPQMPAENLLGEPEGRDTANAVGLPAAVLHKLDPEASFAVVTADHVIKPVDAFADALTKGFDATDAHPGALVTFGIVPNHGHTGLGYIHRGQPLAGVEGAYRVQAFKEKPDKPTADRYVESGRYYWNSGMFVWRAAAVLDQLKRHLPASHAGLTKIAADWGTPRQDETLKAVYPTLPKISIDYAVMEPAARSTDGGGTGGGSGGGSGGGTGGGSGGVLVVEMPVDWLDVGSWPALAETLDADGHDNATDAASLVALDSDGNIVVSRDGDHLIALIGVSDMVVVHTKDATLVCPKSEAQRVKEAVAEVKKRFGGKYV